jgi:hydrogenase maturation protease
MQKWLILGYGNVDRQDDGLGWHVLARLARRLGRRVPQEFELEFEFENLNPEFLFVLQLTPELADLVTAYDQVCFVDAHTGAIPHEIQVLQLNAKFQNSPFTHHMTPETLLSFCQSLYGHVPQATLVSIHGYEFGFSRSLSASSDALADQAVEKIINLPGFPRTGN